MSTIQFKEANCKNCYKCIRSCPVQAISFKNDQAQIIDNGCVLCGKCLQVCPQNAKSVKNDISKVKDFLNKKYKVYASVAPSFAPAFNLSSFSEIYGMFKKLGFTHVEETAVGAAAVTAEYQKLLEQKKMPNIISSACPTVNTLMEKYYPQLLDQLAPVVSPMIAHAKMLKELYGPRIKVVFVGPCLAKKEEFKDQENDDTVDAVITFEEFEKWLTDENLSFDSIEPDNISNASMLPARYYPAPGGIIKSIGQVRKYNYKFIKFDGIDRCIDILNQIEKGNVKDYFIEMNSCTGGCISGTCMNTGCGGFLEMRDKLVNYISKVTNSGQTVQYETKVNLQKNFRDKSMKLSIPDDLIITNILKKIGKFTKDQELNCGACGYSTCREKAIAVYNNKADLHMCLPYMREMAESISNVIIHSTPNAIIAVKDDLIIQEANVAAHKLFKLENGVLKGKYVFEILDCPDIFTVSDTGKDILNQKYSYLSHDIIVEQSILYVKENHMIIIVMKDITVEEKHREQLHKVRCETADMCQNVIDKQMRVVQEIASLLGETTAETKVTLTKLKNSIQAEIGDDK